MSDSFPERWVGYGLKDLRPVRGTYDTFDLAACPTLPHSSDDWLWLSVPPDELDAEGMSIEHQSEREFLVTLERLRAAAPKNVPDSFWRFFASEALRQSVLSPTDCHWEFSPEWVSLPSMPEEYLLRFMSDSQYCYSWYLRVPQDGAVTVVACLGLTSHDLELYGIELESPLIEDCPILEHPELERLVLDSLTTVAASFTEFIHRMWIEGLVWFRLYRRLPLSSAEDAYAGQLATCGRANNSG